MLKTIKKYLRMSPIFSKAVGCRSANSLKLNSFISVFQRFWPQPHLDALHNSCCEEADGKTQDTQRQGGGARMDEDHADIMGKGR